MDHTSCIKYYLIKAINIPQYEPSLHSINAKIESQMVFKKTAKIVFKQSAA